MSDSVSSKQSLTNTGEINQTLEDRKVRKLNSYNFFLSSCTLDFYQNLVLVIYSFILKLIQFLTNLSKKKKLIILKRYKKNAFNVFNLHMFPQDSTSKMFETKSSVDGRELDFLDAKKLPKR